MYSNGVLRHLVYIIPDDPNRPSNKQSTPKISFSFLWIYFVVWSSTFLTSTVYSWKGKLLTIRANGFAYFTSFSRWQLFILNTAGHCSSYQLNKQKFGPIKMFSPSLESAVFEIFGSVTLNCSISFPELPFHSFEILQNSLLKNALKSWRMLSYSAQACCMT